MRDRSTRSYYSHHLCGIGDLVIAYMTKNDQISVEEILNTYRLNGLRTFVEKAFAESRKRFDNDSVCN